MNRPATSHTSQENAFVGWLRRVFGGGRPAAQGGRSRVDSGRQPTAAGPGQPANDTTLDPAWVELAPDFAPHAHALGLTYQAPLTLDDAQLELVAQLSRDVLGYARNDDSGPSSLPAASLRVLNLVAKTGVEVTELSTAIQQDPALTAAVLRVANSAALGGANAIHTVRDAVIRLGVTESGRIAGAVAAKTLFSPRSKAALALFSAQFMQLHVEAASTAGGAAYLAMERNRGRSDLAYLGGMLHDVGKSIALSALAALVLSDRAPRDLAPAIVRAVLERNNVELGTQAHERWSLPDYLTALCASQHDATVPDGPSHDELHLVRAVSGLLALRNEPQALERIAELQQSLDVLRIGPRETRALDAELRRRVTQVRQVLGGSPI